MTQSYVATVLDGVTSKKGAMLLVPAILLVGAALAIGKNSGQPAAAKPAGEAVAVLTSTATAQEKAPGGAASFSDGQRKAIEGIIKDYLLANPEVMLEVNNLLEAKMDKIQSERMAVAVKENADELFRPAATPIVGNTKGDVTLIEFFDYNCGYCRRAQADMQQLIADDPNLKVVLKEFPVLGDGSIEASQVSIAVRMLAPDKAGEFHDALIAQSGQIGLSDASLTYATEQAALVAASEAARQQQPSDHDNDRHPAYACAICAVISLANNFLFAVPPVLQLPQAIELLDLTTDAEFAHLGSLHPPFPPRGPPAS